MDRNQARQRIARELTELLTVFLFIAPFFLSFEAYRIYLLHERGKGFFEYGAALLNALALSKIILTGQLFGLGKRSEHQPLAISTVHKAGMFTLLYILFNVLERTIHGVVHGAPFLGALHGAVASKGEVIVRALAVFFAFIPFFALFEIRRVMGEERFLSLFLGRAPRSDPARDPQFHPSSQTS